MEQRREGHASTHVRSGGNVRDAGQVRGGYAVRDGHPERDGHLVRDGPGRRIDGPQRPVGPHAAPGVPGRRTAEDLWNSWRTGARWALRSGRGGILAITLLCFALGLAVALQQYERLRLGGFDFGLFDQAIRAYARFELPRSTIKNVHHEYPPEFSLLGDHFSPILVLLAPLYWLWNDPRVLLVAQALLFALGVPLVARLARAEMGRLLPPRVARNCVRAACLVYALGAPLLFAGRAGFHEVAFAVPLLLLLFERAGRRQYGHALWAGALLCLTKEDLGLVVAAFGAVLAVRSRRGGKGSGDGAGFRCGLVLLGAGFLASLLAISVAVPAMGGSPGFYWQYGRLGSGPSEALAFVVLQPLDTLGTALTPVTKSLLLLWTFGSLLFLPLGSPLTLCALPLLAERLFSDNENHWQAVNHYGAFLWPVLVAASLETAGKILRRAQEQRWDVGRSARPAGRAATAATAVAVLAGFLVSGAGDLADPRSWKPDEPARAMLKAAALVPGGATVEADNYIAPRLTARTKVMLLDRVPRNADWVIVSTGKRVFPFADVQQQRDRVALLEDNGYRTVYQEHGVHLLEKPTPDTSVPGSRLPGPGSTPVNDEVPRGVGRRLFG
ncbi:DUF2079 domain-containing protein [Streptomyces candidus]|uniref:Putative membrane protein n=1 Tax=Streptomyces candidus TaxID=67283 RepID=A0A7X0LT10_9ACTN|nr:DUF2079 domain-containing protein [Streptomyces candidus]MBB6439004.1 putative membrane protein [Streptomyces candidus]